MNNISSIYETLLHKLWIGSPDNKPKKRVSWHTAVSVRILKKENPSDFKVPASKKLYGILKAKGATSICKFRVQRRKKQHCFVAEQVREVRNLIKTGASLQLDLKGLDISKLLKSYKRLQNKFIHVYKEHRSPDFQEKVNLFIHQFLGEIKTRWRGFNENFETEILSD